MCLAIPGKVVEVKADVATINYGTEQRKVKIADVKVKKGDYAVVQFGFVTGKLSKEEAQKSLEAWALFSESSEPDE